jgi:hypothetical protein
MGFNSGLKGFKLEQKAAKNNAGTANRAPSFQGHYLNWGW